MEKIQRSGHVRKSVNRIVSLICSAAMLMSTVQLSMPTAVYAEAATEAPVSQETQPAVQTETQPAVQTETQPAAQAETQSAVKAEIQSSTQPAVTQPAAPAAAQPAAQAPAQPESQAAPQKEEQAVTPGSSEPAPKSEAQTSSSSDNDNKEPETAYEVSEAAKKFVSDVSSLNWESIKSLRKTQFEADAALVHHPEDAGLKNAASNADQAMKQSCDSLKAFQRAYSALPEEDRADQSVKEADQKLETIVTNLSNYEKSYFTDKVNALDSAELLRISQAAVNAKAALDTNEDEAKKEELEKAFSDADYAHKQSQADLDSLLNVYNQFSDEQKADSGVASAYAALTSLNSQAAAITEPEASESPAETETGEPETEESETDESAADTSAPAAASAKLAGPRRASAQNAVETSITGKIAGKDALANTILFTAVNDTDFFQFKVTVTKKDGTPKVYTTSLSSTDCHASVDFDYNFTITGIPLEESDTVTVQCVPDSSISSYDFASDSSTATKKDGNWSAGTLTLSIAEVQVSINDVVLGDTGNTLYNHGFWTTTDSKKNHTYQSGEIAFWGNNIAHPLTIPKGAAFTLNASHEGYILSTLSSSEITRTNGNSSTCSLSTAALTSGAAYDFVWVKKATDEESTFTKTWLDDGTDTAVHEQTPSLVTLQYSADEGKSWADVSEKALNVPGPIEQTSKANGNKSIYTLGYSGLPEYQVVKNDDGTYTKQQISYRIDEKTVPSGYSKTIDGQNLVNTKEYTLNATIRWQDSDDLEEARPNTDELSPDSIKKLIHINNGESNQPVSVDQGNIQVTDQKDGTYTISIHGLPSYDGTMDNPNTYYIKKFSIPDKQAADGKYLHYTTQISNQSGVHENSADAWNGATITFTISKTIDFSAKKVWEDVFPSLRPKTMLELYRYTTNPQNMELVSVMETPDNEVKGEVDPLSYKDLDAYDKNGRQYHYVLKEVIPASDDGNYEAIYKDASGKEMTLGCPNGGTILNLNCKTRCNPSRSGLRP